MTINQLPLPCVLPLAGCNCLSQADAAIGSKMKLLDLDHDGLLSVQVTPVLHGYCPVGCTSAVRPPLACSWSWSAGWLAGWLVSLLSLLAYPRLRCLSIRHRLWLVRPACGPVIQELTAAIHGVLKARHSARAAERMVAELDVNADGVGESRTAGPLARWSASLSD
jgi:hypothetical protein